MDIRLFKSKIALAGMSTKAFGERMGWTVSTTYRKTNGHRPFTVPEVRLASKILGLSPEDVMGIFF